MTVKQADAINNKFQVLEDSIARLNEDLNGCATSLNFKENRLIATKDELEATQDRLDKTHMNYVNEIKRQDKLEWNDKATKKRVAIGVGAALLTWLVFIIVTIKH